MYDKIVGLMLFNGTFNNITFFLVSLKDVPPSFSRFLSFIVGMNLEIISSLREKNELYSCLPIVLYLVQLK